MAEGAAGAAAAPTPTEQAASHKHDHDHDHEHGHGHSSHRHANQMTWTKTEVKRVNWDTIRGTLAPLGPEAMEHPEQVGARDLRWVGGGGVVGAWDEGGGRSWTGGW